jgi:hypothetical protein
MLGNVGEIQNQALPLAKVFDIDGLVLNIVK